MRLDRARLAQAAPYAVAAALAALPFLGVLIAGQCLYFRDLSHYFFPVRQFVAEGLRHGELRYWNPLVYEGSPLGVPPVSYPLDILQALDPTPHGLSRWLVLHVPLSAMAFVFLARRLQLSRIAAVGGAVGYALGGFSLSLLNLYVYPQAFAWAPVVVALLIARPPQPRPPAVLAALAMAVLISTTAAEIAAQAIVIGVILGGFGDRRSLRWLAFVLLLAALLAAPTLVYVAGTVTESARSTGFSPDVVLANAVYPLTLAQTLIADFHGDLSNATARWWGQNFFPRGFPYVLSLYLGAGLVGLAATGAVHGRTRRLRLLILLGAAIWICLGRWGGLEPLVSALGPLRKLRFPVKAFFSVQMTVALLAAMGLDALTSEEVRRAWRTFAVWSFSLGTALIALRLVPTALPGFTHWFVAGFFSPRTSDVMRGAYLSHILTDAATGGAIAAAMAIVAVMTLRGYVTSRAASTGVIALLCADLVRTGVGLNPTVPPAFFSLSPEMSPQVARLLREDPPGRVFSCDIEASRAYFEARARWGARQDTFTFAAAVETLSPYTNVAQGVPSALGADLTMLAPESRTSLPAQLSCRPGSLDLDRLRAAAVGHVISIAPLTEPGLVLEATLQPARIAPLSIWIYAVEGTLPRYSVTADPTARAGVGTVLSHAETAHTVDLTVESAAPAYAIVRQGGERGWSATVDDRPANIVRPDTHVQAIAVPAGRSRVALRYRAPHVVPAGLLAAAALAFSLRRLVTERRA